MEISAQARTSEVPSPEPRSILVVRLKCIGDVVFTLPAVNAIRERHPQTTLVFLTTTENAPIVEGFEAVDHIITLDRKPYREKNLPAIVSSMIRLWREVRRCGAFLAVDFQGYGETALLARLSNARARWGFRDRRVRGWFYTHGCPRNGSLHPAERNLHLLAHCGLAVGRPANRFRLPAGALARAEDLFRGFECHPARPTLFIQPLTSAPHKDWPLTRYVALAKELRNQGVQIIFGGGPADKTRLEEAAENGFPVSAGVPLLVTAGLAQLSTAVVGDDTGVVHLATALGKQVRMLVPAGSTAIPLGHPDWAVYAPPGEGLAALGFEAVRAAVHEALKLGARSASNLP